MSPATRALPALPPRAMGAGRIFALISATLIGLVAFGLAMAGARLVMMHTTQRDSAGFYTSDTERLTTQTFALTSEGLQIANIEAGADWVLDAVDATVRVHARSPSGEPLFVGIALERDVDAYLARSAHEEVTDVHGNPSSYDTRRSGGAAPPGAPAAEPFWVASASGAGTRFLNWKPGEGRWAVVVMNADGERAVAADVSVGARSGALLPIGGGLLVVGLLGLAFAVALVMLGVRTPPAAPGPGANASVAAAPPSG